MTTVPLDTSDQPDYTAGMPKAKTKAKTPRASTTRTRKAKRRGPGGKQPGAGRPGLFVGTRVKVGVKLTTAAVALIAETREHLRLAHGPLATDSAAVEYLVRKAAGAPMELRPVDGAMQAALDRTRRKK